MSLLDLPKIIREALCGHEIFRRHGFTADQIFVSVARDVDLMGVPCLGVEVHHGDKTFRLRVGPCDLTDDELGPVWRDAVAKFNARPPEAMRMWVTSEVYQNRAAIAVALRDKGLVGLSFKPVS